MLDRDLTYFGVIKLHNELFELGRTDHQYKGLFKLATSKQNIRLALKRISSNPGRDTVGVDGLKFSDISKYADDQMITIIRRKLKWEKPLPIRKVYIPKSNGKKRPLGIGSIIDRVAQQCILNLLIPITESKFSDNSYAFRLQSTTKHAFSRLINGTWNSKELYHHVLDVDFEKYFENVKLDDTLDVLRDYFNIKDPKFLETIKRLLWTDTIYEGQLASYTGIGLPQGSILGPVLSNVLLHTLDLELDSLIQKQKTYFTAFLKYIKENKWHKFRNGLPYLRYSRYADDIRVITPTKEEAEEVLDIISNWSMKYNIPLNKEKTSYYSLGESKKLEFVGYVCDYSHERIIVYPRDQKEIIKLIKSKWKLGKINGGDPKPLIQCYIGLLNQYSICSNLNWLIDRVEQWLYQDTYRKRKVFKLEKETINGKRMYYIHHGGNTYPLDLWNYRTESTNSVANYIKLPFVKGFEKDKIHNDCTSFVTYTSQTQNYLSRLIMFLPGLLHRQKFKCPVSGENLQPDYIEIHHKIPSHKGGKDSFQNLIVTTPEVHKALHYGTNEKKYIKSKIYQDLKLLITK